MRPTLVELFGLKFHSYVTLMSLAFLVGTFGVLRDLQRRTPPIIASTRGGFWGFVGALLGAKVFWILQYDNPLNVWRAVIIWEGGMVFYGGLIGGVLAAWLYVTAYKYPVLIVADTAAPFIALGEALGRAGCYLNGCCWGLPTSLPWGVCFPPGSHPYREQIKAGLIDNGAAASLPVHPTQIYTLVGLVLIYYLLKDLNKRGIFDGAAILGYCMGYGLLRFWVEALREGPRNIAGMTLSQVLSALLFISATSLFIYAITRKTRKTREQQIQTQCDNIAS